MKRDIVVARVEAIVSGINALMAKKLQSQPSASIAPQGEPKAMEGV
jgi:hypothetical protein